MGDPQEDEVFTLTDFGKEVLAQIRAEGSNGYVGMTDAEVEAAIRGRVSSWYAPDDARDVVFLLGKLDGLRAEVAYMRDHPGWVPPIPERREPEMSQYRRYRNVNVIERRANYMLTNYLDVGDPLEAPFPGPDGVEAVLLIPPQMTAERFDAMAEYFTEYLRLAREAIVPATDPQSPADHANPPDGYVRG